MLARIPCAPHIAMEAILGEHCLPNNDAFGKPLKPRSRVPFRPASMAINSDEIAKARHACAIAACAACSNLQRLLLLHLAVCRLSLPVGVPGPTHQAFVAHYYQAFDAEATRPSLAALYQPQSMLSFEGSQLMVRRAGRAGRHSELRWRRAGRAPSRQVAACSANRLALSPFSLGRRELQQLTRLAWGVRAQGGDAIMQKLCSLQFKSCQHKARPGGATPNPRAQLTVFLTCSHRFAADTHPLAAAQINTCDAQPSPSGGILVFVSGDLLVRRAGSLTSVHGIRLCVACFESDTTHCHCLRRVVPSRRVRRGP